jgi:Trehalase
MPKAFIYQVSSMRQRDSQHRGLIKLSVPALLFFLSVPCFLIGQEGNDRDVFEKMFVGAFDPDAWNGIVFDGTAHGQRLPFAIRVGSKSGRFLDGERIFDAVSTVGPHAPDGSYALLSWRHYPRMAQVTLEWSRIDRTTVVGRLKAPADMHLVLEAYSPFESDFTGAYYISRDGKQIIGDHHIEGHFTSAAHIVVATDRPIVGTATFPKITELREVMDVGDLTNANGQNKEGPAGPDFVTDDRYADDRYMRGAAGLEFITNTNSTAHFVATVGWNVSELTGQTKELLEPGRIDTILNQKALQYEQGRPHIKGLFSEAPSAIGNSMFWNTLYVPSLALEFPSISRSWAKRFGGWVVGEWDCFFGSLLTNVEDTAQTSASTRAILLAQSSNGVVPNFASGAGTSPDRSQPPVGSYVMWKNYQRNQDKEILQWAYPRLKRWHEWWFANRGDGQPWRDGNRNGLLEWGSDKGSTLSGGGRGYLQGAKWESGMDDSPMYDDVLYDSNTYTMNLDDVGLNSLYALDSECLAEIAEILGKEDDKRRFTSDYERIKRAIQQQLWNEQDGIYENRYWDGHFSRRLSPTNFYPMLAGVATPEQAKRMVKEHLLSPKQFWGQYVIPTISRDDAAFEDQFYWRGDIWGPTNYLVYEGLNRYGEDEVALQFADKGYDLFMDDWHAHQHTNEQYYAWGGNAGGDKHYTWGALLCLIPIEQYMDETPWDGLRFGALNPHTSGELSNYTWNNHRYNIAIGPDRTAVESDGVVRFEANAGVVVRNYKLSSNRLSFAIKTPRPTKITTRELAGALSLKIDERPAKSVVVRHGNVVFAISAGEHRVVEVWK